MKLPWGTLGLAGAAMVASAWPAAREALWLPTEGWAAQPWRLWTCHLVHHDPTHLLWDLGAFVALGGALEGRAPRVFAGIMTVGAGSIGLAMGLGLPANGVFGGLSGIDAALFLALAGCFAAGPGRQRVLGLGMGALFLVKVAMELVTGGVVFAASEGVVHAPSAHLVGACVGGLSAAAGAVRAAAAAGASPGCPLGRERHAARGWPPGWRS